MTTCNPTREPASLHGAFPSVRSVFPTLVVGGMAFSCALLVAVQSLHVVVA